ncbi:hypothetical protein [Aromatoleum sp.]|uniref:hypothetical protein n=1 Tax=Aromatoleum sp. TaxID=2307007 RepID=UPI002FCB65BD
MTIDFMFGVLGFDSTRAADAAAGKSRRRFLDHRDDIAFALASAALRRRRSDFTRATPGAAMIPERPPQLHAAAAESGSRLV